MYFEKSNNFSFSQWIITYFYFIFLPIFSKVQISVNIIIMFAYMLNIPIL